MRRHILQAGFAAAVLVTYLRAAPADAFAAYHEAIDRTVTEILSGLDRTPLLAPEPPRSNSEPAGDERLHQFAARFWNGREDELRRAVARLGAIRSGLEALLKAEGVPENLVAVVLVESAAQPLALSSRNARGLWQLIPETARRYGLTVSAKTDDRVQTERATRAAARYLRDLYAEFGDWQLAFAAYNAGEDTVAKALARSQTRSFAELRSRGLLPRETRQYVPAVMAAMDLLGSPAFEIGKREPGRPVYAGARATD